MKLSGMMRGAHVPPQLGPLWDNFHKIYENAKDKQAARRERVTPALQRASATARRVVCGAASASGNFWK
jgi:hypothetical protein